MNDYKIKELYEEMEKELIASMKRNYQRHLNEETKTGFKYTRWQAEKLKELKRYQRENQDIIGSYTNNLSKEIAEHMQEELRQGSINAIKQYNKVLKQDLKPSKIMNKSFFKTNDRKVNALIKSVSNDLKTANTAILRMANDQYRQVIHKSAFFVGNGVFTEQQAARMAAKELTELELTKLAIDESNKDFLNRGLACIEYADGRRLNVASYSQMAVRTANLRAQLMGEGDFRKSIGRHLVQATSHGGACPICQKWEKHIFIDDVYSGGSKKDGNYTLLSVAMKQGFLHPNCRHGLTTYYPEAEGIEDETEEEYQADMNYINQRINYIERNIKRYDRLKTGSIDTSNVRYYSNKEKQWKNELKTSEIIKKTRDITSTEFQKRTKGIKVSRIEENYSYIDLNENRIFLGTKADEYDLIHELAHKLQMSFTKEEEKMYNQIIKSKFSKYTKKDFKIVKGRSGKYWILKDSSDFVSAYQTRIYEGSGNFIFGRVNIKYSQEYFSEGVKYYYKNPSLLKNKDSNLYNFIKKVVDDK